MIKASPYTKLFWIEHQLNPHRDDYNIVFDQTITGPLDVPKLSKALVDFVNDYLITNSHLKNIDGTLYWEKNDHVRELDIFQDTSKQKEFVHEPFLLDKGPLYRFGLFKISEEKHEILLVVHHTLLHGPIADQFIQLISDYYNSVNRPAIDLDRQAIQINELTNDLDAQLEHIRKHGAGEFWQNALESIPQKNEIPYLKTNNEGVGIYRFNVLKSALNLDITKELNTTIFTFISTVFGFVQSRYCGSNSIALSYPLSIKKAKEYFLGAQLNSIVLPVRVKEESTIASLIEASNNHIKGYKTDDSYRFSYLPTSEIVSNSAISQLNISVSQTHLKDTALELNGCESSTNHRYNQDIAGAEIILKYAEGTDEIEFSLKYQKALFEESYIHQLAHEFSNALSYLTNSRNTHQKLSEFCLLTPSEFQKVVVDWNQSLTEYPKDKTIHQLFEAQVELYPDNIAVSFEDQQLTYAELNEKSNQLARYIQSKAEIQPDTLVALCLDRSPEMIIAILGVLKSGAAYVPISPEYPKDRIDYIVEDACANLMITQSHLSDVIWDLDLQATIQIDQLDLNDFDSSNLPVSSTANDLAYVIYTSGTTGKPKGVLQTHGNVQRLFSSTDHQFNFSEKDVWTLYHSYIFDFTVWELWGALTYGGKLVVPSTEVVKDIPRFIDLCIHEGVTILNQTPAAFYTFAENLDHPKTADLALRYIIFGGDALNVNLLSNWWKTSKKHQFKTRLINMYGITETTVHVTFKEITEREQTASNIGTAIDDLTSYVLDANNNPVPIGVPGELHIGGAGLAKGYLNRPELTKERFLDNPFASQEEIERGYTKLYKTGDLVRWLPNGDLEYIGRNDFQVKIRGHRIELGEIENALSSLDEVNRACVLVKEKNGSKYLVAYYVADEKLPEDDIIASLTEALPEYMIPSAVVYMDEFPVTINGKLDRRALPDPDFSNEESYIAPTNDLERKICEIWQEVLNLDKVGITDDFFRIGGDSIISIRAVSEIKKLGIEISVRDILLHKTVQNLIKTVKTNVTSQIAYEPFSLVDIDQLDQESIEIEQLTDLYPASHLQTGILLESERSNDGTYHDVFSYQINKQFKQGLFENILEGIIQKHDLLRASFVLTDQGYISPIHSSVSINEKLFVADKHLDIHDFIANEKLQNFTYEEAGLFRFFVLNQTADSFILVFSFHHAITDGWSVASLISEITNAYINETEIQTEKLPLYGEFVRNEHEAIDNKENQQFWTEYLNEFEPETRNLKLEPYQAKDNSPVISKHVLSQEENELILEIAEKCATSVDVVFIALYQQLLSVFFGQSDVGIGIVANNRLEKEGGDRLFGLHLNTVPLRQKVGKKTVLDLILDTRDNKNKVYGYKAYPYGKLKADLNLTEDIYQCAFNYIHFHIIEEEYNQNNVQTHVLFEKSNIPLVLCAMREENTFSIDFIGDQQFIDPSTIERLKTYYVDYLKQISAQKDLLFEFQNIPNTEYQQITVEWNQTDAPKPNYQSIVQLFEEQVAKSPDNIAVEFDGKKYTYQELNDKANQLARVLKSKIDTESVPLIAICSERNFDMVVGVYGILKAGAAYVPIDPKSPDERIEYILQDTNTDILVTQSSLEQRLNSIADGITSFQSICLDKDIISNQEASNLELNINSNDSAYIIYTSGTTGRPKGVIIDHDAVLNFAVQNNYIDYDQIQTVAGLSSISFDASIFDIFVPILSGKKVVLFTTEDATNFDLLAKKLNERNIDTAFFTTALLNSIVQNNIEILSPLKQVIFGGESSNVSCIQAIQKKYPSLKLVNAYGPTETVVYATRYHLDGATIENGVPIGKALNNKRLYVLDAQSNICPIGGQGELHIGGQGLAKGYLNQPELTAQKFIDNPFATSDDLDKGYTKLYKTGDIVRWLPDGNLEFVGRNDKQVKIRGYRIELEEIEKTVSRIDAIKQSIIQVKTNGDHKFLVGYYLSKESLSENHISEVLSKSLPEYMIPDAFVHLSEFPMTTNGKIDFSALPDPVFNDDVDTINKSTGILEQQISEIYADLLGIPVNQVNRERSFFKMGGNSILVVRLQQHLRKITEFTEITSADLFKYDSVRKLLDSIGGETDQYNESKGTKTDNHEIAIIGVSAAFSGAENLTEFWKLIEAKKEGIDFLTKEECESIGVEKELLDNPNYIPSIGKVKDIDLFDPGFWNMSPKEAQQLDPQIRKFIEHCWTTLESSGYIHSRKKENIGVFAGSGYSRYYNDHILPNADAENMNRWEISATNNKDALATKTAYHLGLTGPAISSNTACSTSLVTIVEACQKLQVGSCDMALAGGVSFILPEQVGYIHQKEMILSADGHCRTFDKTSSGVTMGSGVGVVLLKRLDDAIKDNDNILGVIKGYATNNDGDRKTTYTSPSVVGQSECIINAQKMAGITSNEVNYVECHGTATNLGDPIEIQALKEAFNYNSGISTEETCHLGAVKANIGHADSAAGIAGVIKVCLMLQNNTIPGQINFNEANPELHLETSNFEILKEPKKWERQNGAQRIAGISSFGVGGTNAHVVLSDFESNKNEKTTDLSDTGKRHIVKLSAKSRKSLEQKRLALLDLLRNETLNAPLSDVAYTLQERREHFELRLAYSAESLDELTIKMKQNIDSVCHQIDASTPNVFMFPGQGSQYNNMTKALYINEADYQKWVDQCIQIANQHLEVDLLSVIYPGLSTENNPEIKINDTQWAQIALFTTSYSIAKYAEELGIRANAYLGHSIGEFVAATLSGVFTLEDAIKLVITRGQLMQSMEPGSMLAVKANLDDVLTTISDYDCELAAQNSETDLVISGESQSINSLQSALKRSNIPSVKLKTSHAYHSKMMDQAAERFSQAFKSIQLTSPEPHSYISNLTGDWADDRVATKEYWCQQLRNKVEFAKGIQTINEHFNNRVAYIEMGMGKGLSSFVRSYQTPSSNTTNQAIQLFPSLKEKIQESVRGIEYKQDLLALFWSNGLIENAHDSERFATAKHVSNLPTYQFDFQKCWLPAQKNSTTDVQENSVDEIFGWLANELKEHTLDFDLNELKEKLLSQQKVSETASEIGFTLVEDNYSEVEHEIARLYVEITGVNEISVHDDFFKLGGNSISAINLSNLISEHLNTSVTLAQVFDLRTPQELARHVEQNSVQKVNILPQDLDSYPLSFAQERLWFIEQYEKGTNAYHIPILLELQNDVNTDQLKKAINSVVQRHEALRTVFKASGSEFNQVVLNEEIEISEYHFDTTEIARQIDKDINTPFDLRTEIPIRVSLYFEENRTRLLLNIHHIASDGWSVDIILREIGQLYNGENLSPLTLQYKDFSVWQRQHILDHLQEKQGNYWINKLNGFTPLDLPTDYTRPKQPDFIGDDCTFTVNAELSNQLRALSEEQGTTIYTTLLSAFYILLHKYTSQDDLIIGSPVANRHYADVQHLVGFFINSLALRASIDQNQSAIQLMEQVQTSLSEVQSHQDIPFEKIVELLDVEKDPSKHPVYQVMFSVQSFGHDTDDNLFVPLNIHNSYSVAKYDLSCFMDDSKEAIKGIFNFATALYDKATISNMMHHYVLILEQMVEQQSKSIKDYNILSQEEYQKIVVDWNQADYSSITEELTHELFEQQVERTPNVIALRFKDEALTYSELNEKANQLARYIRSQSEITTDTLVALFLDRGFDMMIGILGTLKAGAAYVPISPEYPAERINYILNDSDAKLILTQTHLAEKLISADTFSKEQKETLPQLITLDSNCYAQEDNSNLKLEIENTSPVYVIYTSGTTGNPKGVVLEHSAFVNRILPMIDFSEITSSDAYIFKTNYVFDVSASDIFTHLFAGAQMRITEFSFSLAELTDLIKTNQSNSIHLVPSQHEFVAELINNSTIEKIYFSGEKLTEATLRNIRTGIKSYNYYGPTELGEITRTIATADNADSIGKVFPYNKLYVVDQNNAPVPVGVVGELHVSGNGLAQGYLNKEELTNKKFIANPFADQTDIDQGFTRLYKTGDLVKWLPDGSLAYIGRNDFQVKINGNRIELGEIENVLCNVPQIKQACVVVKETGNKFLAAYYVSEVDLDEQLLVATISQHLPPYMIPSTFTHLEAFPLTINGKLDRRALPEPTYTKKDEYVAPSSEIEHQLCAIWQSVLEIEQIGITDDFFRIGGNSITAIKLVNALNTELKTPIEIADIFELRTVQNMSEFINTEAPELQEKNEMWEI